MIPLIPSPGIPNTVSTPHAMSVSASTSAAVGMAPSDVAICRSAGGTLSQLLCLGLLIACSGPQSVWEPAGRDALRIASLTAWMTGVGLLAWVVVLGIGARALGPPPARPLRAEQWLVGLGGVVVPALLVAALLGAGLPMTITTTSGGAPLATVVGEQWWWRIRYDTPGGPVELANELILPVGIRSAVKLESPDVIHSLWIPRLAGPPEDPLPKRALLGRQPG